MADNDNLCCGNCGYDGGRAHLQEKLKWQDDLAEARRISDDVRVNRAWVAGLATVICAVVAAIGINSALPPPTKTDAEVWSQAIADSYSKCVGAVGILERSEQARALQGCNDAFKDRMNAPEKSEE